MLVEVKVPDPDDSCDENVHVFYGKSICRFYVIIVQPENIVM